MKEVCVQRCFETGMLAVYKPYRYIRSLKSTKPKPADKDNFFALLTAEMDRKEEGWSPP